MSEIVNPIFLVTLFSLSFVSIFVKFVLRLFVIVAMAAYTYEEYADMMLAYGFANSNASEAKRLYQERYPNRRVPDRRTFSTTYRRLRETGNLQFQEPRVNVHRPNAAVDERILDVFDQNPTISIRAATEMLNLSIWKVWSVLRAHGRHPFHYTPVQGMYLLLFKISELFSVLVIFCHNSIQF